MFNANKENIALIASDYYSFITIKYVVQMLFEQSPEVCGLNALVEVFSEKNLPALAHAQINNSYYDLHIIIANDAFFRVVSGSVISSHTFHIDINLTVRNILETLRKIFQYCLAHAHKPKEVMRYKWELTQQESLYLNMLHSEHRNRRIALTTGINERNISKIKRRLMDCLGVKSTQELFMKSLILARSNFFNVIFSK